MSLSLTWDRNFSINIDGVDHNFFDRKGHFDGLYDLLDDGNFFFHNFGDFFRLHVLLVFLDEVFFGTLERSLDNLFNNLLDSVRFFNIDNFFNRNLFNHWFNHFFVFGNVFNSFSNDLPDDFDGNFVINITRLFFHGNLDCDRLVRSVLLRYIISLGSKIFASDDISFTKNVYLLIDQSLTDDFPADLCLFGNVVGRVICKLGDFVEVPFSILVGVV